VRSHSLIESLSTPPRGFDDYRPCSSAALYQRYFIAAGSKPADGTTSGVSAAYQGSFICNCDLEDMGTQAQNWLVQQYGNSAAVLAPGTIITLKFADGSTAQFIKISGATDIMWQRTGTAHDKNGNLINSHGPLAQNNPNTSGGGSASASAFGGTAPQVVYGVTGFKSCTVSITAVNPDGSTASLGDYTIPC
jgi:hypothetical protein